MNPSHMPGCGCYECRGYAVASAGTTFANPAMMVVDAQQILNRLANLELALNNVLSELGVVRGTAQGAQQMVANAVRVMSAMGLFEAEAAVAKLDACKCGHQMGAHYSEGCNLCECGHK